MSICGIEPDVSSFNRYSYAHLPLNNNTSSTDRWPAANECESLLRKMQDKETEHLYVGRYEDYAQSNQSMLSTRVFIDTVSYNTCINAWAKSGPQINKHPQIKNNAAMRAQHLLEEMQNAYLNGNDNVKPNTISFSTCINSWAHSKDMDGARCAQDLLELILELEQERDPTMTPNSITCNLILNAWSKSTSPNTAIRAQDLLYTIEKNRMNSAQFRAKPSTISFSTCMKA